jgi:serine/threonine-protein kinase RsbW
MGTITLQVCPDPAHVRIVRLVSAAFARRAGLDEGSIDEVKLAVGEACGMAVSALEDSADDHLTVELSDAPSLRIVVRAPLDLTHLSAPDAGTGLVPDGLDVIRALLDDVDITTATDESVVAMSWPVGSGQPAL